MITKPGDKKLIVDFTELVEMVKASNPIDRYESAGDKRKRIAYLLANYEAYCEYYYSDYCYAPMGWFQKDYPMKVYNNPNNIYEEQWSRGFAKSTHFGLFLPTFMKFNGQLNGMALGSLNEKMACERLTDIQANLMANKRIINDFGEQYSYGNWDEGAFKTKDDCGFYAFGKDQSPRGTRFRWKRPNYGAVDDLNAARQLKNQAIANEDKRWVMGELKPALWTQKWWLVIMQNKFHENTVTALIENDEEIKSTVHRVDIRNEKGISNWPENPDFTEERIKELEESEGGDFIRERMNTPFEEGSEFKAEWMNNWVEPLPLKDYDSYIIHYLDPSYKSTEKSDFKFWVLLGKKDLNYDILDAWGERCTSKDMWEHAFDVDKEQEDYSLIYHCMEGKFIQEEWHEKELKRVEKDNGRALRISYDRRDKGDKGARVKTMQPLFQRGYIRFNIHKKATKGMKLLRSQLLAFEQGSAVNDDGPDALEGAIWMADRSIKRAKSKTRTGKYKKDNKRAM